MYFSLIITFILFLGILITSIQNTIPIDMKFFFWQIELSLAALVIYSALLGGAIIAVLSVPKLVIKSLKEKRQKRELNELKKKIVDLEQEHTVME
jgi:uncharacterized integral membrane protein